MPAAGERGDATGFATHPVPAGEPRLQLIRSREIPPALLGELPFY